MVAIRLGGVVRRRQFLPALTHRQRQGLEHVFGVGPADAGVGDGDAISEADFAGGGDFLVSWGGGWKMVSWDF
jgi:hypothetical protein